MHENVKALQMEILRTLWFSGILLFYLTVFWMLGRKWSGWFPYRFGVLFGAFACISAMICLYAYDALGSSYKWHIIYAAVVFGIGGLFAEAGLFVGRRAKS